MRSLTMGLCCVLASHALADVTNMPAGMTSLELVEVGNAGNPNCEFTNLGSVGYTYQIGKYEVTAGQYCEFLNAVASTDAFNLYNEQMSTHAEGCQITRSGTAGYFTYSVAPDWANRPVNFVSWADSARFCNWLTNGQPVGGQNDLTTEGGLYELNGAMEDRWLFNITRKPNVEGYALPTNAESYKAAFHKNDGVTANYWEYATQSDVKPDNQLLDPDPGNNANFTEYFTDQTIGAPYYRTEVGAFENSESAYGTYDFCGNVMEWNDDLYYSSGEDDPERIMQGSSYDNDFGMNYNYISMCNTNEAETHHVGFRIAFVPEPASCVLLAFGAIALRKRR